MSGTLQGEQLPLFPFLMSGVHLSADLKNYSYPCLLFFIITNTDCSALDPVI